MNVAPLAPAAPSSVPSEPPSVHSWASEPASPHTLADVPEDASAKGDAREDESQTTYRGSVQGDVAPLPFDMLPPPLSRVASELASS